MESSLLLIQNQISNLASQAQDPEVQKQLLNLQHSLQCVCQSASNQPAEQNITVSSDELILNESFSPHIQNSNRQLIYYQLDKIKDHTKLAPAPLELLFNKMCDHGQKSLYSTFNDIQQLKITNTNIPFKNDQFIQLLADQFTFYATQTGFKSLIPNSTTNCFAAISDLFNHFIPKICSGMTLDEQECQRYLEDTEIYPKFINNHQLSVLFKRAIYRQTKLIQEISMNNKSQYLSNFYKQKNSNPVQIGNDLNIEVTNYGNIKRLNFFGFQLLVHCVAEHIFKVNNAKKVNEYKPEYTISSPYDTYKYSDDVADIDQAIKIENSWKVAENYANLLDKYLTRAHCYGLQKENNLLTPDIKQYQDSICVFSKYIQVIKNIFNNLKTESRLVDSFQLFKILTKAEIQTLLSREFVFEVVFRNFSKVDKQSFIPGLNQEEFLTVIFVCSNFALCQEPYIRQYKRPEQRLEYVLKKLLLAEKTRV